jgi:predicted ABC-type ATPase
VKPILCLVGGCNGAGKTTLARELLPLLGLRRFLNADEIARGLSPLDPSLATFRAGRLLIEETRLLLKARGSFGLESTLSGRTHVALLQEAKRLGYHVALHYILIDSAAQAVERVALRVKLGGHDVPEDDVRRRFDRSRRHFLSSYLPLTDDWVLWDNAVPPHGRIADSTSHQVGEIAAVIDSSKNQETSPEKLPEFVRLGIEASRIATAKMLDYYKRMGIEVTPYMTLAKPAEQPESPKGE